MMGEILFCRVVFEQAETMVLVTEKKGYIAQLHSGENRILRRCARHGVDP
jgi:hypothetical protein